MEVREQLVRLVRIQELVLETRVSHEVVESGPRRLEEIEQRFRERNAEYVEVKERHEAVQTDQLTRSDELGTLEEHRKKYMDDLMQVTNQREYSAMLREIDTVKGRISEHEESILKDMEELEGLKKDLEAHEAHIQEERIRVEKEREEVQAQSEQALRSIGMLGQERLSLEAGLSRELVDLVARLEAGRQGVFLARAVDGICQSCFVRVRPQVFQEIRTALVLHACASCRRLLYTESSLRVREPAPSAEPEASSAPNVEALNGGAV